MSSSKIPEQLRDLVQWVVADRNRVPYNPRRPSQKASVNDPSTWGSFDEANQRLKSPRFEGLAFVFTAADPFVGLDLDACLDPKTSGLTEWARAIVDTLHSYTEISPSGTGLRIVVQVKEKPEGVQRPVRKLRDEPSIGGKAAEIMICHAGGMLHFTGNVFEGRSTIRDRTATLARFHKKHLSKDEPKATPRRRRIPSRKINDGEFAILLDNCRSADDRSVADYVLCCIANEKGWSKELVWKRVKAVGKFHDRGREYFDLTWQKAYDAVRSNFSEFRNAYPLDSDTLIPIPVNWLIPTLFDKTAGWPRRVGDTLFIHDSEEPDSEVAWIRNTAALFGWLQGLLGPVHWHRCNACVTKEEFFHELRRHGRQYEAILQVPHEPALPNYYYLGKLPAPGDGKTLDEFLTRFSPADPLDRELILAAFLTPMWGGSFGGRPIFVITADGRGHGKTTLANMISSLYGGAIEFRKAESIETINQRLLSPQGRSRRIVVLDNLKTRNFSWAEFESLITAPRISGKQMYVGEGNRPNDLTFLITVNAASFSTDIAQRSIFIRLARPRHSGDWLAKTRQFLDENREALLADLVATLRRPRKRLSRHSRWGEWERDILSRLKNPRELQALVQQRAASADVERQAAEVVEQFVRERLEKAGHDPASERIRISSKLLVTWYNQATDSTESVFGASSKLRQMADEGQLVHFRKDPSHKKRRSFIWTGEDADPAVTPIVDFNRRAR